MTDAKTPVLLVGESWMTAATHFKGWDHFASATFHLGAEPLVDALRESPFALTYMPAHEATSAFPLSLEGLNAFAAIILSDIGANSLLLHPDVWLHGTRVPNRLALIRDYVESGGGLLMVGGYLSFQGINGSARYRGTPVEQVLPVEMLPYDDRIEVPEGFLPEIVGPAEHPILDGLAGDWPHLLGANEVRAKTGGTLLARLPVAQGGHPLLIAGESGAGRTLAWTSDIGPHWLPAEFVAWPGYQQLWCQALAWLTKKR